MVAEVFAASGVLLGLRERRVGALDVASRRRSGPSLRPPSCSRRRTDHSRASSTPWAAACPPAGRARALCRFEADGPNEVWIGDVLIGPCVQHPRAGGSRRA